jgi:hypothetical protein
MRWKAWVHYPAVTNPVSLINTGDSFWRPSNAKRVIICIHNCHSFFLDLTSTGTISALYPGSLEAKYWLKNNAVVGVGPLPAAYLSETVKHTHPPQSARVSCTFFPRFSAVIPGRFWSGAIDSPWAKESSIFKSTPYLVQPNSWTAET